MNVACGMEMSISLKLCGAEVYVCKEGEMKCWFGRGTKPTGTNVARMERIYHKHNDKSTRHVFIFLQQLLGGGEFCGIECWKVGNKFYVFGTIFFGMIAVKLFLLFNILNFYHKAFLAWNGVVKKPLKWQKCFVADVPYFENLLCFLIAARD